MFKKTYNQLFEKDKTNEHYKNNGEKNLFKDQNLILLKN